MRIKNLGSILVFPTTASDYHSTVLYMPPPPGYPPESDHYVNSLCPLLINHF